ncbi:hypothetical protein [Streptomyces sp. YIM B13518]|uniref:hypothetical protein n=1 Tax=Streptomyces sp. YIM B13518 TaxID=3366316 RepID=UPI0036774C27
MDDRLTPHWLEIFENCGLEIVEDQTHDGPPVNAALHAVNGVEVRPSAEVSDSDPQALEKLSREWHRRAEPARLFMESGDFLVLPPGSGGSKVGWVRVRDRGGEDLPSRVAAATGAPEFIAVSVDGGHLCASTVEDDDYWVVVHEF